ncbi:MAG: YgaP family membrane protein [Desulfovibrionales bacterium]
MKENVGGIDRKLRFAAGPGLLVLGYLGIGGRHGRTFGLLTMLAGFALTETAITRVCPLNALFGIDSRSSREMIRDRNEVLEPSMKQKVRAHARAGLVESPS